MDENQVKALVTQMLSQSQYGVGPVQYHTHNGIDSASLVGGGLPKNAAQGDIIYYNGTAWVLLSPGNNGQVLETQGSSNNPIWATQLPLGAQGDMLYYTGSIWTNLAAGTSGQFLETQGSGANPKWAVSIATGSVMLFGTATPPTGWLLCNGQGVSTSTYSTLFALIGYTYGGSGSTFDVPNLNSPYLIVQPGETAQVLSGAYYYDIYTTPGSYNWQCPKGVTTVYVQCYGGGGSGTCGSSVEGEGGGGGGGFGYKTITVVPGTIYPLFVGAGGGATSSGYNPGQSSNFISSGTVQGNGGSTSSASSAGGYVGDSGYNGGAGGIGSGVSGSAGNGYGGGGGTSSGIAGGGGGGAAGNGTNLGSGAGGGGTGNAGTPGAGGGNYLQFGGQNAVGMTGGVFGGGGAGFYGSGLSGAGGSGAVYVQYAPPPLSYIIKT